ncbi:MAG: DUF2889 domain-containing protein [Candidatus Saccharibacteria bacterium]
MIYQSSSVLTVKRIGDQLLAEATMLSTDHEAVGWMHLEDVKTFAIKEAGWEILRAPGKTTTEQGTIPQMVGLEAYFNAGRELKKFLPGDENELARELLADCIRGIIQAETYLFPERGYESAQAYDAFWDKMYIDSCLYYSNLDKIEKPWMAYAAIEMRQHVLFNRSRTCEVRGTENGHLLARGSFIDSFHELAVHLDVDNNGVIIAADGEFRRAPDKICFSNTKNLPQLTGNNICKMGKKDIAKHAGGAQGCNHLVDLLFDIARAVNAAK